MSRLVFRTWHGENAAALAVLLGAWAATGFRSVELLGVAAVFCGFCHASIAERMREREAARSVPSVECHAKARWFFVGKELAWCAYFALLGAWSALVGVGLFLAYPLWRAWWRRRKPLGDEASCPTCGWSGRTPLPVASVPPIGVCPSCSCVAVGRGGA